MVVIVMLGAIPDTIFHVRTKEGDREFTFVILNGVKRSEESRFYAVGEKRFFPVRVSCPFLLAPLQRQGNDNSRSACKVLA